MLLTLEITLGISMEKKPYIKRITSDIEQVSIDECFLDYGKVKNLYGDELVFAHKLKNTIYKKFGFTVENVVSKSIAVINK